jgi:formate dehydrogenase major subunit
VLWGSNAREAHPIFFHHLIKGLRNGARMFAVDPRRTSSAKWADVWLGIEVGSDIALANAVAREIIHQGWHDLAFIEHATIGFAEFAAQVEPYTLEYAESITGVPTAAIASLAHAYATAPTAQLLWTLGITEHHNASDNVFALCNLALLTGHVGRWGSGLVPLRGQNNVQGGGDMGALPNKLPGFADIADADARARYEAVWGMPVPPDPGLHLTLMFEAMERKELRALWVIGENPADSEANIAHARAVLEGLDTLVVSDIVMTRTAEMADVVLPAAAGWAETDGTVTSSERRVQRVRAAIPPPGEARDDIDIIAAMARAMGHDWTDASAQALWDELRTLSPLHTGMSYERLEQENGLQWPCPDETHPGSPFLHARLWADPVEGPLAPFTPVEWAPPADALDDDFPLRLTTGRMLDSYNTGVQSSGYDSPIRSGDTLDLSAADASIHGLTDGEWVRVSSRRGAIDMPVRIVSGLPTGTAFATMHFPERIDVNQLTNDAWDPKSGTAEFKATAVRIDRLGAGAGTT